MPSFDEIAAQMAAEQQRPAAPAPEVPEAIAAPSPPPPPTMDELAGQMKAEHDETERRAAQLMRYRSANDATPPEQRAQVLKYSAATGLPPDLVAANFDRVKREVDAKGVDWAQLRREMPGLRQYLDDRPEGHPLAQDDLEQLHGVEWALQALPSKLGRGVLSVDQQLHRWYLDAAESVLPSPDQASDWQNWVRDQVHHLQFQVAGAETQTQLQEQDAGTYGATSRAGKMLVGTAGALPVVAEYGLVGLATGGAGTFALGTAQGLDTLQERLKGLRDQNGDPLDPEAVDTAAHVGAVLQGALNIIPVGKVLGLTGKGVAVLPGSKALLEKLAGDAMEQVLQKQGAPALLKRAVAEWGVHTLNAGFLMGLQGAVNQAAEEGVKGQSGLGADPKKVASAFADSFVQGLNDMALIGAMGQGRELLAQSRQLEQSRLEAARYEQAIRAAGDSKMLERSPVEFEAAAGKMAEQPDAAREVSVPVEAWNTYWQAQKVDPAQVAEALLGDQRLYQEAVATRGDLSIPAERFIARLGKTEHLLGLREDVRLSPESLTPREMKVEAKAREARLKEEAAARGSELERGKAEVEAFINDQARAAGIPKEDAAANAKLVAEYAGTMALRLGVSVQEAANVGALNRLSILGPKGEAVAAAARERFAQFLAPSASRVLGERLATMSPEARAREYYVDPVSGLLNRRAFDALPAPEGKQVAVVTLPDVKAINDSPEGGHDRTNELLRVAGAAVGEADPQAARSGTNFILRVKDQAELDQVLARVRAALPDQRLAVEGALGATPQEAGKALDAHVDARRAAGELPARGTAPAGLEVGKLTFPEGRARGVVPLDLVSELGALSPEEYFRRAYQDEKSPGILSREGWDAIPRKAYVASIDLRGLKDLNAKLGKAAGDEVLRQFGDIAEHFGGSSFDFSHLSGDEYAAQADDPAHLEGWLEKLRSKAQTYIEFQVTLADGSKAKIRGADFRSGIARGSYGAADRALNEAKLRERAGTSAEAARDSGGINTGVDQYRGNGDLAEGRGALGRGAPAPSEGGADQGGTVAGEASPPLDTLRASGLGDSGLGAGGTDRLGTGGRDSPAEDVGRREHVGDGGRAGSGRADRSGVLLGDLADQAPSLGRGATPQGFPGVELRQAALGADTSFDFGANVAHIEGAPVEYGPSGLREARAAIGRMRPDNREAAQAFLEYSIGQRDTRPEISPELERRLAEYGVVDPAGYSFDEAGREMARPIGGPKKLNQEPASLREYRMRRQGTWRAYEQAAPTGGGEGGGRGSISFRVTPEGRPVEFRIEAFRGDRSTLAHETAHFLSWSLHEIATSDLASPDVRADYDALLKWAGYDSPEQRLREQDAAKEEKFSHAWEQYLAEGKAPSSALARVFSRFKDWMLRIYRGLGGIGAQYRAQHGEDLQLSDEVRGIFGRLLAADESLTRARADAGVTGRPDPNVEKAMTPAEREQYRKALVDARTGEEAEVAKRAAELDAPELRQARARIAGEVAAELDQRPEYRVQRFLQRGELADGKGGALIEAAIPDVFLGEDGQPLRLNREKFAEQYGEDAARAMPPGTLARGKAGVSADELAPLFGYETGAEMASKLITTEPRDKAVERLTQERMDATYGPALQRLQAAALAAIHSDAQARVTLMELRQLAKEVDPATARRVRSINLETLKDTAERMVGETPLGALNPERYLRAERATALRAERLWGQGKKAEALDEKEARLLNQVLYRAARDTQERLEKARTALEATSDAQRAALGKADPSYRDVHDALLKAVDLGPGPADPATALGLDAMLQRAQQDAQEMDFDVAAIRALLAEPAPWERLTADEAQNVVDAVANIRTAARRRNEVTLAGKTQTKDAFFARMKDHLAGRQPLPPGPYTQRERTLGEKASSLKRSVESDLMDVGETLAHMLDAGERNGPAHELLVDGRLAARDAEAELTKSVLEKVAAAYEGMPEEMKKLAGTKVPGLEQLLPMPEGSRVRPPATRDALYALFLNSGNEGNRQRLRDGNGWSDEQVQRALNLLKPEEAKFLQGVLDVVDKGLWEQLAKVYEARTGLPLEKVRATAITVNGESYGGGYFPIRYDERSSRPGELQADAETVAGLFQGNYQKAAVSSGHTKARVEKVDAAVLLDWNVLPAHLAQVIHDISYGDWVRQAGSLVLDQRFKDLAAEYLGTERRAQLVPWLQDVANARADSAAGVLSQAARTIGQVARGRLAVAALGFNVKAFALHTFDPWKATWEGVGMGRIAAAYLKVMAPWRWGEHRELALSKEIAARETNFREDLRRTLAAAGLGEPGLWRKLGETQFRLYEWIDRFTSRVTFKAAFDGARAEGLSEADAARRADDAVRRTLASHDVAEKPRLMRSKSGLGAIVMFYGYANRGWNQRFRARDDIARTWGREDATATDKASAVAGYAAKMMALSVIGAGAAYLAGRGPKKKDDPEAWAVSHVLMEPLHEWPFVGGLAEKAVRFKEDGSFFVGQVDARTEPGLAYLVDTINRLGEITNKARSNSLTSEDKLWFAVDSVLGLALGGQVAETADYAHKLGTGQARPRGPLDVASGLVYGEKKEPVATPLTGAQDLISQ
jgi:GGDEF domain-containing protein